MKIEILGIGCPGCRKTASNVEKAVEEVGIDVEIVKIEKIEEIIKYGVMETPALVVDASIKCVGRIPTVDEIKEWLM